MAKRCTFKLNRKAFSQQILKNETLQDRMREAAKAANTDPKRVWVHDDNGTNRNGVVILCPAAVEKKHGTLEDTLGRMRV